MTYTSNRCIQWYAGLWTKDLIFYVEVHTGTVVIMTDQELSTPLKQFCCLDQLRCTCIEILFDFHRNIQISFTPLVLLVLSVIKSLLLPYFEILAYLASGQMS